jgi:Glyoxalase-like domain
MATGIQVVFDCADPDSLARFWAEAIGYKLQDPPTGYGSWEHWAREQGIPQERWNDASAVDPDNRGPRLYFQRVPEAKTTKNRVHLDLNAGGAHGTPPAERRRRIDAEVERLLGARDQAGDAGGGRGVCGQHGRPRGQRVRRSVTLTGTLAGRLGARVPAMCHIRRTSPASDGQPRSLTCRR